MKCLIAALASMNFTCNLEMITKSECVVTTVMNLFLISHMYSTTPTVLLVSKLCAFWRKYFYHKQALHFMLTLNYLFLLVGFVIWQHHITHSDYSFPASLLPSHSQPLPHFFLTDLFPQSQLFVLFCVPQDHLCGPGFRTVHRSLMGSLVGS